MSLPSLYYNDDKLSFAYSTVHKRWPLIIEGAIKDVSDTIGAKPEIASSGNIIVEALKGILVSFKNDEVVKPFSGSEVALNGDLAHYNSSLAQLTRQPVTWLTGPWLYLECYLYQLINVQFIGSSDKFWHTFDIFENLKNSTFKQSELGVLELCKRYQVLHQQLVDSVDADTLKLLFHEFIDISLWGNATDLSLLAGNVTLEDIKSVQGAEVRKKNEENILVNDLDKAWSFIKANGSSRVDIVLDNSGFELFADLIFALFVLDSNLVKEVHLHCKEIPWFVSDTMPKDFHALLAQLVDSEFYPNIHQNSDDSKAIQFLHSKLVHYHEKGQIIIKSDPFWTLDDNYWNLAETGALYDDLRQSSLIIFKGDLNYRKLTGDLQWDKTTPFTTAIQALAKSNLPVLSLRTCKADVVVGLEKGVNEKLIEKYKAMGNDVGEFWSSSGKWAVISFSKGT